jgi:hypothetical protein
MHSGVVDEREKTRKVTARDGLATHPKSFVIDPRRAKSLAYWDTSTAAALIFVAVVTPFEVALVAPGELGLFVANRVVDCVFAIDIILQFFLAYPAGGRGEAARWVVDQRSIALHYLKGWFLLDCSTTAVAAFDIISFAQPAGQASDISRLKVLRVFRVLRLVKLLRLLRGFTLLKRWETRMTIDYASLSVLQAAMGVILCAHWSACVWTMQVGFADDLATTWVVDKGYCVSSADGDQGVREKLFSGGTPFDEIGSHRCVSGFSLYSAALYWAIMTITYACAACSTMHAKSSPGCRVSD